MTIHAEVEFDCPDCKRHILSFGYQTGSKVCSICQWIREIPDISDEQRDFLRKELTDPNIFNPDASPS